MRRPVRWRRPAAALLLLALAATGCVDPERSQRQPESAAEGLQATGLIDGRRVAISSGEPDVVLGDCDPNTGLDRDLCVLVRTIDGMRLNIVIENPDALVAGERLPVRPDACGDCDDVRDHLVIELRVDGEDRPVERGHVTPSVVADRIAAEFDLRLPSRDRLTGRFDVRPGATSP